MPVEPNENVYGNTVVYPLYGDKKDWEIVCSIGTFNSREG